MLVAVVPWIVCLLQAAVLGAGAGRWVLPRSLTLGERWVFALALGLGADAYLILALGLLGALYPAAIVGTLLLAALLALPLGGGPLLRDSLRRSGQASGSKASPPGHQGIKGWQGTPDTKARRHEDTKGAQGPHVPGTQGPKGSTTQLPNHPTTPSPNHPTTPSPNDPITQPPNHPTTQRPNHPTTHRPHHPTTQPPNEPWWLVGCGVVLALMVVGAVAPPSSLDWDGLSYHLAVPRVYLQHHRILFIPYDHHSNFPFTVEMLFTLGLALGSPALAVLFHTAFAGLTAAALAAAWGRFLGRPSWLPAFLFLVGPMVLWEATVAYIDLGVALYVLLATVALMAWRESTEPSPPRHQDTRRGQGRESREAVGGAGDQEGPDSGRRPGTGGDGARRWLWLAGICAGLAMGCKTTAAIPVFLLGVWLLLPRAGRRWASAADVLAFALPALVVASPWYVKTYLYTGNPVYPFLYSIFGGVNWNAELARVYAQEQAQFGAGKGPADLLLAPWRLAFEPQHFSKGVGYFGSTGAAFLGLLPLVAAARRVDRRVTALLILCLGVMAPWFLSSQQSRYLLPLFPLLALVCAWPLLAPEVAPWVRRAGSAFAVAVAVVAAVPFVQGVVAPAAPVAFGAEASESYLNRTLDLWPAARFVNQELPKDAKLLLFEETRGFYFDRPYLWANPGHSTLIPYDRFGSPEEMVRWFRARGYTHALINFRNVSREWGRSRWEALLAQAARRGLLQPVFRERQIELFVLRG